MQSLKPSLQGLAKIRQKREQIAQERGWTVDNPQWLLEASSFLPQDKNRKGMVPGVVSIGTWKRFLAGKAIKPSNFKAFCQVLRLNWKEIISDDIILNSQDQKVSMTQHSSEGEPADVSTQGLMGLLASPCQDWGEAIDSSILYGRTQELVTLEQWIVQENCRLVGLFGMGGIGKTSLSVKLAQQIQDKFEYIIWRSLQNAPPVNDILATLIQFLSQEQVSEADLPESSSLRITLLIDYLRSSRCLLVLDNTESILQGGASAGQYRSSYEGYGELIKRVGETSHRSCLVLTSREKPQEMVALSGEILPVRSLELTGLNEEEGRTIFQAKGAFAGTPDEWKALIQHYAGNPLALKLVASVTLDVFGNSISEVVKYIRTGSLPFADISQLLERQFNRLTDSEQEVMYWLSINREPISFSELKEDILSTSAKQQLADTLKSLKMKSMIEIKNNTLFGLQPVLIEYVTNLLIDKVSKEIIKKEIVLFNRYALLKATAIDHARDSQIRFLIEPIKDRLLHFFRYKINAQHQLFQIISGGQTKYLQTPGYTAGNVINLLCQLNTDLSRYDFSHLRVWQPYQQSVSLNRFNLAHSKQAKSVFADPFNPVFSKAYSSDSVGDGQEEINRWRVADAQQILTLEGHTGWVHSVAFSPDGKTLASSSDDHTISLWDVKTGIGRLEHFSQE